MSEKIKWSGPQDKEEEQKKSNIEVKKSNNDCVKPVMFM